MQYIKFYIDDDAYLNHPTSPDLGDIKLDIVKAKIVTGQRGTLKHGINYVEPGKIHERSKKAVGHRAQ